MKKLSAFMLSLMLCFLAVMGNLTEVSAAAQGNSDMDQVKDYIPLPSGVVKLMLLDDNHQEITATDMEIGDVVKVGIRIDASSLNGTFYDMRARFAYDEDVFNIVKSGDVAVYQDDVAKEDKYNSDAFSFERGWDSTTKQISLNAKQDSSGNIVTYNGVYGLEVTLMVKKAVNDITDFTLANITVRTESTNAYTSYTQDGTDTPISCSATNEMKDQRKLTLSMYGQNETAGDTLKVAKGGAVNVPVYVQDNTGFNTLHITVSYDSQYLEFTKVVMSSELRAYADLTVESPTTNSVTVSLITSSADIHLKNLTKLFDFNFTAKANTVVNNKYKVTVAVMGLSNISDVDMQGVGSSYNRDVQVGLPVETGDVNQDGNVTLVDAAYLLQYYNGVRALNQTQLALGDVNGSGTITLVDVLMIMKHYNGETVDGWVTNTIADSPSTP